MRIDLSEESMDIVMKIVRKKGIKLSKVVEFIINNPHEIEITRGELDAEKGTRKDFKK